MIMQTWSKKNYEEIIIAINTHRLHCSLDFIGLNKPKGLLVLAGYIDDEPREESEFTGLFGSSTNFLDPRNRLLDMLTPNAKQNRFDYLDIYIERESQMRR